MSLLQANELHELFEYRDGVLYWKKPTANQIKIGDAAGSVNNEGYLQTFVSGKAYKNHRIIFAMHHGYLPRIVDHKDTNKLNNRIENLRDATLSQNQHNRKLNKNSKSGIKGVYWNKRENKWQAQIKVAGKNKYLGRYDDSELAELVATKARNKYHGEYANHV